MTVGGRQAGLLQKRVGGERLVPWRPREASLLWGPRIPGGTWELRDDIRPERRERELS